MKIRSYTEELYLAKLFSEQILNIIVRTVFDDPLSRKSYGNIEVERKFSSEMHLRSSIDKKL